MSRLVDNTLADDPMIGELTDEARSDVKSALKETSAKDGALIFSQGDAPHYYYCLLKGYVRVSKITPGGTEVQLTKLASPYWFGEMSFLDGAPRTHSVYAASDIKLGRISKREMKRLLRAYPDFRDALTHQLCQHARLLYAAVDDFLLLTPEQRLAKNFLKFVRKNDIDSEIYLTQNELARMVGVSRQSVSRILKMWQGKNIILRKYGRIEVLDRGRLEALTQ